MTTKAERLAKKRAKREWRQISRAFRRHQMKAYFRPLVIKLTNGNTNSGTLTDRIRERYPELFKDLFKKEADAE